MSKIYFDPNLAAEGKEILVGVVSMLVGLLDTFGAQVHEDPAPYDEASRAGLNPERE